MKSRDSDPSVANNMIQSLKKYILFNAYILYFKAYMSSTSRYNIIAVVRIYNNDDKRKKKIAFNI